MPRTTFSLSSGQLRQAADLLDRTDNGDRPVLGLFIEVLHAPNPVEPPEWRASIVFNSADGGDVLGEPIELDGKGW